MWAFAAAAVRSRPSSGDRARDLAETRFAEALRDLRPGGGPRTAVAGEPDELAVVVAAYGDRIGDVELSLPGAWTAVDPLLRSEDIAVD